MKKYNKEKKKICAFRLYLAASKKYKDLLHTNQRAKILIALPSNYLILLCVIMQNYTHFSYILPPQDSSKKALVV